MKNLKKVLAVVLAFAMIIGTNAFAASFSDLDKTASYAEAVSVLADLGILKGYDDGTVKPEGNITRAEFAAIVCRIKGLEDAANSAKDKPFSLTFLLIPGQVDILTWLPSRASSMVSAAVCSCPKKT